MSLTHLELQNFRNLPSLKLDFSQNLSVFYGANAQGKTNLLEAINFLATLRSFRSSRESELIGWGQEASRIFGKVGSNEIELMLQKSAKKISLNHSVKNVLEVWGIYKVVSFYPQEVYIVMFSPDRRRKYLDSLISFLDRSYLFRVVQLQKVLRNRNRTLYFIKERRANQAELEVWDQALVDLSVPIWLKRKEVFASLNEILKEKAEPLFVRGQMSLKYQPKITLEKGVSQESLTTQFREELRSTRQAEIERSLTLLGPHRDDFSFVLEEQQTSGKNIKKDLGTFGSRGEQKMGLLSLKTAELDLIEKETGERPSLILDGVLAELDASHREQLFGLVKKQPTFITSTSFNSFPEELIKAAQVYKVENGQLSKG